METAMEAAHHPTTITHEMPTAGTALTRLGDRRDAALPHRLRDRRDRRDGDRDRARASRTGGTIVLSIVLAFALRLRAHEPAAAARRAGAVAPRRRSRSPPTRSASRRWRSSTTRSCSRSRARWRPASARCCSGAASRSRSRSPGRVAVPVNRWLIARGKGHAAVHETGIHGGPPPRVVGALAALAFVFGAAVLVGERDRLRGESRAARDLIRGIATVDDHARELAAELRRRLIERRRAEAAAGEPGRRARAGRARAGRRGRGAALGRPTASELAELILRETVGLGPLEELLADPAVEEVMVNGHEPRLRRARRPDRARPTSASPSEQALRDAIERILAPLGRRVDELSPMVDARLADGSRVNVVIPPLAVDGPALSIRRFPPARPGPERAGRARAR